MSRCLPFAALAALAALAVLPSAALHARQTHPQCTVTVPDGGTVLLSGFKFVTEAAKASPTPCGVVGDCCEEQEPCCRHKSACCTPVLPSLGFLSELLSAGE